jgi:hypothetical protein
MWNRVQDNSTFTLGGEYFYRHLQVHNPFRMTNVLVSAVNDVLAALTVGDPVIGPGLPVEVTSAMASFPLVVQQPLDPFKFNGHGNFGSAFGSYRYRGACDPYLEVRGYFASGTLERGEHCHRHGNRHHGDDSIVVTNNIPLINKDLGALTDITTIPEAIAFAERLLAPAEFEFSNRAHEWEAEARFGYTWGYGCRQQFMVSPYLGVGYQAGRMNFAGRQRYWWWYLPVGLLATYDFWGGFEIGLDADFGCMGRAHYEVLDDPMINNINREMGSRYTWQLELPLSYSWCSFSLGLVPFWHGWRTKDLIQGERNAVHDEASLEVAVAAAAAIEAAIPLDVTCSSSVFCATTGCEALALTAGCIESAISARIAAAIAAAAATGTRSADQPVASPAMLNNSWGGRLELGWSF